MTPLMVGSTPAAGTGSTGPAPAAAATAADSFASVLAGTDPAAAGSTAGPAPAGQPAGSAATDSAAGPATDPASATGLVSAALPGESFGTGEPSSTGAATGRSVSHRRPADPSSAAVVLAADFAVAALALPVPVPVPAIPAAVTAWSAGGQPVASQPGPLVAVQPGSVSTGPATATLSVTAMPAIAGSIGTPAAGMPAPETPAVETPSAGIPSMAPTVSTQAATSSTTPAGQTAPTQPTAAAGTMPTDPARPAANGTGQPASSWLAVGPQQTGQSSTPVSPDVPVATKPAGTGSAIAHDQLANPVQAGRPQLRPNTGSGTGSGDREHADGRLATPVAVDTTAPNGPSDSPVFTLADSQSVAAAQSATVPATTSQPTTSQPQPTTSQPTSSQLPAGQQQAAPQVSHQLAAPVLSLRTAGNGSHQLTIALHPAELGPVNVHVRILGDSMSIQLASTSEGAHDALREALPQLRQELQAAGLPTVDLSLDLGGAPSGGQHAQAGTEQQGPSYQADQPVEQPIRAPRRPTATTAESGLDRWL